MPYTAKRPFNIRQRIMDIQISQGMSNHDFAVSCNVADSTACKWMQEGHDFRFNTIEKICDGLNVSLSEFFSSQEHATRKEGINRRLRVVWNMLNDSEKVVLIIVGEALVVRRKLFIFDRKPFFDEMQELYDITGKSS